AQETIVDGGYEPENGNSYKRTLTTGRRRGALHCGRRARARVLRAPDQDRLSPDGSALQTHQYQPPFLAFALRTCGAASSPSFLRSSVGSPESFARFCAAASRFSVSAFSFAA